MGWNKSGVAGYRKMVGRGEMGWEEGGKNFKGDERVSGQGDSLLFLTVNPVLELLALFSVKRNCFPKASLLRRVPSVSPPLPFQSSPQTGDWVSYCGSCPCLNMSASLK